MIDVRCRKHVDLKAILDFYKLELESHNKSYINEALRRYSIVSKVVGKEYTELYLLPLILKVLEIGSYEVNHIVSEELVNIIDLNTHYTEESKKTIKDICNNLLFNEEMSIRMESIKSLEIIFSRLQDERFIFSFIEEILLPIIKTKFNFSGNYYTSSSSSLTDKLSLCNIIPSLILPYCNKFEKNNLLLLYLSLCDDEVPSLRIGASQKLVKILKNIFPLKCGMTRIEYQKLKLSDQNIITEKLLNLVLALYKDQTCDLLKSASIGIAIQLYTNPIFYIEFISCDDRDSLLYFICSIFENRTYLQRQAVIEELIPLCLSLKGYYELSQEDNESIIFNGYILNGNSNILSNIRCNNYSVDIIQFIFDNLTKEVDIEIRLLTFKFIEKLLRMGIEIFESNRDSILGQSIEYERKTAIDDVVISVIMYINKNISDLLMIGSVPFKCIFCIILVQMIIYSQQLFEYDISNRKIKNSNNNLEHLKIKDMFIQIFISHFNDPNINVVSTAIENLYKIINLVSEEQLSDYILPKIKSILFVEIDLAAYNNERAEKSTALHKWRIIRCIIRQIPLWIRYNQPCSRICPFYNSIIVRSILDTTFSVSISALQTIMRIISKLNDFNECTIWINEFIIPSILMPFIEDETHSIKYTFDIAGSIDYNNIDDFSLNKNVEIYEYKFRSCDYMNRIFIMNLIFAIYRSLFYKWVYINFQEFKDHLNSVTSNIPNSFKTNETYIEGQKTPPFRVLSSILDGEELFIKLSELVVPLIINSIDDSIKNVSIATLQLVVQVIKIFSLDLYFSCDKEMFACSSFGERDGFGANDDSDELLKEHLLNQFELDSVWHLRNIMSNSKIDHKSVNIFSNCIYQEFIPVFEKIGELEIDGNDTELTFPIISIKEWYNIFKKELSKP
ncbi:uncharacterized protein cubi_01397 [Cryptosporidium ubiquitum]|uniref:Uncharacterized protein n=1 Tax=Cryptosporidium ubiquitum TaxID=857276 RepID=A0A1J4MCU6_9CRYT|nr:uncharacterized protein cubi_01397 [Cryptosporidium ubiquitum]OII72064.1 hypothetical protein cubi_01397 [Cryptosporidium ubiquitum]